MEQDVDIKKVFLKRATLRHELDPYDIQQLAHSIKNLGLLQAIVVEQCTDGTFSLIAGRRRLEACKLLEHSTIPARILEPKGTLEGRALAENLIRKNLSPLEEAEAVGKLHTDQGLSIRDIGELTSHSTSWVQDRLALLNLDRPLKVAVHERALSIGGAFQLSLITDVELRDYYIHLAKVNGASIHQCEAWQLHWKSQRMLTQPDQASAGVTQPLPLPLADHFICYGCRENQPRTGAVSVTLCKPCHAAIQHEIETHAHNLPPTQPTEGPLPTHPDPGTGIVETPTKPIETGSTT